jgi:hypothetical protein
MRSTLYEALEIDANSEVNGIRSALRKVLRRFWSAPRDPSGDSEEAVRFVALASGILTDDARRQRYDVSARPTAASLNPWRNDASRAFHNPPMGGEVGNLSQPSGGMLRVGVDAEPNEPILLPDVPALADALPNEALWADRNIGLAFFTASALLLFGIWALMGAHLGVLALIASWLVCLAACVGGAISFIQPAAESSATSLSRLAIVKWRRESSVFLGLPPPQQDTAWIFRLRMMELTRGAAGFLTQPSIGLRLLARCADYALVSFLVLALLGLITVVFAPASAITTLLRSAIALPLFVVLLTIIFDALCIKNFRMTPGKWLIGAVVVLGVTQTVEQHIRNTRAQLAWNRAITFARTAMFFGIWPLTLLRAPITLGVARVDEGAWEEASDSVVVVRQTPLLGRAAAFALTAAAAALLLSLWLADGKQVYQLIASQFASTQPAVYDATSNEPAANAASTVNPIANPSPPVTVAAPPVLVPQIAANKAKPSDVEVKNMPLPSKSNDTLIQGQLEEQARAAQERRMRIERTEAQVARTKQGGSYAGLQASCQTWTEDQPSSAEAWRCLGLAKFQSGDTRGALPALRESLKYEPNDREVEATILRILRP